jgi:adenylate cyclase
MVYLAFDYAATARARGRPAEDLRRRIKSWLDADPVRWRQAGHVLFEQVCGELGREPNAKVGPQFADVALALREVLGDEATVRDGLCRPDRVWRTRVAELTPVYFEHARAAKRCGFVVFEPDPDGVMRRMRLFIEHEGRVLPQLACALALDELGWRPAGTQRLLSDIRFQLFTDGGRWAVPIDRQGRILVPWLPRRDWTKQFGAHVPVDALWQVYDRRLAVQHNDELIADVLGVLVAAGRLPDHAQYADDLKQLLRLRSELRLARYGDDAAMVRQDEQWIAEYDKLRAEGEARLRAALPGALAQANGGENSDYVEALHTLARALAANKGFRAEIENTVARLRPRIKNHLCLVGYTATALADMTPIPTSTRAPGVMAHANVLNGFLTGRSVGWVPTWLNAALALVMGLLAIGVSVGRGPRAAAIGVTLLLVVYVALAGWVTFYVWLCWIALTPAVAALLASYVAVLLFRYVFLERASRQVAVALSQYTSATLARKMAEDAELCRRAEVREVTAVFTDLAGFTPISERIGAERTQRLLNTCLGRFSEVMLRYEGMINKFIGDGIFAFWNPVIYPQPDHARRACQAAVDLLVELGQLIAEQRQAGGDEAFGELVMRIGVATGNAVVGPCGSEQKYDYTCIGDSVNVAARLESANKFYGTHVLISGATRDQAGDGFVVRPLGGVQVKGKTQAVPVFELLGRSGDVSGDLLQYAERFGAAVAAFQQRDWSRALELFETCQQQRRDDLAARHYAEALRQFAVSPPAPDWNGALELSEK